MLCCFRVSEETALRLSLDLCGDRWLRISQWNNFSCFFIFWNFSSKVRGKQEAREKWFMLWGRNREQLSWSELQARAVPGGWVSSGGYSSAGKHFQPPSSLKA